MMLAPSAKEMCTTASGSKKSTSATSASKVVAFGSKEMVSTSAPLASRALRSSSARAFP